MTNLKDKLSASVRQAKASAQPTAKRAAQVAVKTGHPPAPTASQPAASKPMAAQVAQPVAAKPAALSGIAFPDRVWPD